jgi:Ni/Fe-hydrogenase subunit HybB-like protein
VGLVPDLATARDRAAGIRKRILGWLSLGWDGAARTWSRYETACLLLAGLATPLVVSVHSVVSADFATAVIPGWHATVFPPYFVIGAVFSGFAMVLTLMLVARRAMRFEDYITERHVGAMCKVLVFTGTLVGMAYLTELFMAWYSANPYERFAFANRALGPYAWAYWTMMGCNLLVPQLLWFRAVRSRMGAVFAISIVVNVGMWFERFVIIVTSLHRDFLPSSWSSYAPTWIELATLAGSFGLFFTLFHLFIRYLPMIAASEIKGLLPRAARSPAAEALPPAPRGTVPSAAPPHRERVPS